MSEFTLGNASMFLFAKVVLRILISLHFNVQGFFNNRPRYINEDARLYLNERTVCSISFFVCSLKSFVISITYQSTVGFVSANGPPISCLFSFA